MRAPTWSRTACSWASSCTRSPIEGFPRSRTVTAAACRAGQPPARSHGQHHRRCRRQPSPATPCAPELRTALIARGEARRARPTGYLVDEIEGGFTHDRPGHHAERLQRAGEHHLRTRIYADGQTRTSWYAASTSSAPRFVAFANLIATGDDPEVFNGYLRRGERLGAGVVRWPRTVLFEPARVPAQREGPGATTASGQAGTGRLLGCRARRGVSQ